MIKRRFMKKLALNIIRPWLQQKLNTSHLSSSQDSHQHCLCRLVTCQFCCPKFFSLDIQQSSFVVENLNYSVAEDQWQKDTARALWALKTVFPSVLQDPHTPHARALCNIVSLTKLLQEAYHVYLRMTTHVSPSCWKEYVRHKSSLPEWSQHLPRHCEEVRKERTGSRKRVSASVVVCTAHTFLLHLFKLNVTCHLTELVLTFSPMPGVCRCPLGYGRIKSVYVYFLFCTSQTCTGKRLTLHRRHRRVRLRVTHYTMSSTWWSTSGHGGLL